MNKPQVFISYASEDLEKVKKLYEALLLRRVRVWCDLGNLSPGKWKNQITKAINNSRFFVLCVSKFTLQKTSTGCGFQDEELEFAYHIATNQDENKFTIVPVRFEECGRGDHRFSIYQQFDLFPDWESALDRLAHYFGGWPLSETLENLNPQDEDLLIALHKKERSFFLQRNFEKSLVALDAIKGLFGETAETVHSRGYSLHMLERDQESITHFEKAVKLEPDNSDFWLDLGMAYSCVKRSKDAIKSYREAMKLDPRDSVAYYNIAHLEIEQNNHKIALKEVNRALDIRPRYPDALFLKVLALSGMGKFEAALETADYFIENNDELSRAFLAKGIVLVRMEKKMDSLVFFEKSIKLNCRNIECLIGYLDILLEIEDSKMLWSRFRKIRDGVIILCIL